MLSKLVSLASDHDNRSWTSSSATIIIPQWRTPGSISEYVSIYLSCVCFYCFNCSYSLTRWCLCLFPPTVLYHHQQHQHILYQHLCHQDVLPFKCNQNTTAAAATTTQSDNGNGNRDTQTTTQQRNADRQQSFSIIDSVDRSSSIKIMTTMTSFFQRF